MNIIAIMGPHGVYHKDQPIQELKATLVQQGFKTIWPQNSADLIKYVPGPGKGNYPDAGYG